MEMPYKEMSYKWNDGVGNYCLATEKGFIGPLQPLKLSEVDKEDLAESLQSIFYKRTGEINEDIGISYEKDKKIAKKMNCWD